MNAIQWAREPAVALSWTEEKLVRYLSVLLLAAQAAHGQTASASIGGTVLDAKTLKPAALVMAWHRRYQPEGLHVYRVGLVAGREK
jgi:hypothetical protein